jgi:hypothetical protein
MMTRRKIFAISVSGHHRWVDFAIFGCLSFVVSILPMLDDLNIFFAASFWENQNK